MLVGDTPSQDLTLALADDWQFILHLLTRISDGTGYVLWTRWPKCFIINWSLLQTLGIVWQVRSLSGTHIWVSFSFSPLYVRFEATSGHRLLLRQMFFSPPWQLFTYFYAGLYNLLVAWLYGARTSLLLLMVLKVTLDPGAKMKMKVIMFLLQSENAWISVAMLLFLSPLTNLSSKDVVPVWFMHVCPPCLGGATFLLVSPEEMRTMEGHWHLDWIPWPNIEGPYLVISDLHSVSSLGSQVTTSLDVFLSKGTRG